MATLAELRAEAKRQKRKGYSKLKKAELEKLLDTPPPKPPRGVPRKKPASQSVPVKQVQPAKEKKLSAREIREQTKIPYSVVVRRKDSDGIPYISVWDSYLMRAIKLQKDEKYPRYEDDEAMRIVKRTERELKSQFRRGGLNASAELTPKEWGKKFFEFMDKEDKEIKAVLKRKGLE